MRLARPTVQTATAPKVSRWALLVTHEGAAASGRLATRRRRSRSRSCNFRKCASPEHFHRTKSDKKVLDAFIRGLPTRSPGVEQPRTQSTSDNGLSKR